MALTTAEVARIKAVLGYNVLTVGALPYIGHSELFDQVIVPYMQAGASTTSSTSVTAVTTPTAVTLTIASATGFTSGDRVVIDVDDLQEVATIRSLSGTSMGVVLSLGHAGTYPVTVEGGESIVREKLAELRTIETRVLGAAKTAGLKRAEDLEWYNNGTFSGLLSQRMAARDELASILGVANMWRVRQGATQTVSLY